MIPEGWDFTRNKWIYLWKSVFISKIERNASMNPMFVGYPSQRANYAKTNWVRASSKSIYGRMESRVTLSELESEWNRKHRLQMLEPWAQYNNSAGRVTSGEEMDRCWFCLGLFRLFRFVWCVHQLSKKFCFSAISSEMMDHSKIYAIWIHFQFWAEVHLD